MYSSKQSMIDRLESARAGAKTHSAVLRCEPLESRRMLTGTWTTVTAAVPGDYAQSGWVLTDGSIMVHGAGNTGSYFKLTPNNGSYVNGTWTTLHSSNTPRLYFASQVLQSGKVFQVGGEYVNNSSTATWGNTGEIYDPVANTWSNIANFPNSQFGDDPSVLLPNGQILCGYLSGAQTYIYDPVANTWTATGTKLRNDRSDEECWVTLPDHSILSYDIFSSISLGIPHAQRYIPSTGTWVDAGTPPAQLSSTAEGDELGPGLLLPDGRVFYSGATANTAYYTEATNSWTAGPAMPGGYVSADAAGAVLPNGDLLLAGSPPASGGNTFPSPTKIFELNPLTNVYMDVTPSSAIDNSLAGEGSFTTTFMVLPTGQIAVLSDNSVIAVYTESGSPVAAAVPVITGISFSGTTGVYTLSGTNLNGINDGAAYGDDNEMASNYPLVRLTDSSGNITYARTTNWSLTGVFQGAETVTFTLPAADTTGAYLLQSVANGVPSATALAVLVNANTTPTVTIQSDANPANVDVVGSGTIQETFPVSSFSSIYFVGDNNGDTLSVKLTNSDGSIVTNIQAGTATDTINVNQTSSTGPVVIDPSTGTDAVNVGTAGAGTAIAQFLASQQIGLLTVGNGGSVTVSSTGTKKLLQINGLVTSGTGVLDLTDNYMIVHGGNLATLIPQLFSGLNLAAAGYWNGPGIISSTAAADTTHTTALGIILNNINGNTLYGSGAPLGLFEGQNPSLTDVLIKYTYYGDTNLDGHVDGSDYSNIDFGYMTKATGWFNGDFNYDNTVNGSDYTLIDNAFNTQGASIAAAIANLAVAPTKTTASQPPISTPTFSNQPIEDDWTRLKRRDLHLTTDILA